MIETVFFVKAFPLFSDPGAESFSHGRHPDVKAELRDGCVVFSKGPQQVVVPFSNVKALVRTVEAAKK